MTTYNTGNPIGSTAVKDLYDNAENLDVLVNDKTKEAHPDRLGQQRKTWHGMEQDFSAAQTDRQNRFNNYIASSGYQFLGDYAAGIEITEYNQIVRDSNGEFWRLSGQVELPYTTTGAGLPEDDSLTPVGDAALRQELGAENGALIVRGVVIYVDTIADLQALDTSRLVDGQQVLVKEYHAGTGAGGGEFYWDAANEQTPRLGTRLAGAGSSIGRWIRKVNDGRLDLSVFGARYNLSSGFDDDALEAAISFSNAEGVEIFVSEIAYLDRSHKWLGRAKVIGAGFESGFSFPNLNSGYGIEFGKDGQEHLGASLRDLRIKGEDTTGLTCLKINSCFQGTSFENLFIYGGDKGVYITETWTCSMRNIYVRDGGSYGIHIKSPTYMTQVNAVSMEGIFVQGYETNWFFDGDYGGGTGLNIQSGASELSRKTSMIVDSFFGLTLGPGFYFEGNYSDAATGSDTLDSTKPVDILIKSEAVPDAIARVTMDRTYHAIRDDFVSPGDITSVYVHPSATKYTVEQIRPQTEASREGLPTFDFYDDSTSLGTSCREYGTTGAFRAFRGNVRITDVYVQFSALPTAYLDSWEVETPLIPPLNHDTYMVFNVRVAGTTTSNAYLTVRNAITDDYVQDISIPAGTYTQGQVLVIRVPKQDFPIYIVGTVAATGDNVHLDGVICKLSAGTTEYGVSGEPELFRIFNVN